MPRTLILESITVDGNLEFARLNEGSVTIGRDTGSSIVIDSVAISRRHAAIVSAGSQWVFTDLGSTNGSWVNGIQANPGQIRLLRDGDTIQLSDVPVAIKSQAGTESASEACSVLVFLADAFQNEFKISPEKNVFQVGGLGGDVSVEGEDPETVQFVIKEYDGRLELEVGRASFTVIVNGMATQGAAELRDRDEITFGLFKIVVNDMASLAHMPEEGVDVLTPTQPVAVTHNQVNVTESFNNDSFGAGRFDSSWETEDANRRMLEGQKFVFGTNPKEEPEEEPEESFDPTGTMSYRTEEFKSRAGLGGMSMSQRISSISQEDSSSSEVSDVVFAVIVILILAIVSGAVYLIVSYL